MSEFSIEDALKADYVASAASRFVLKGALEAVMAMPPDSEMLRTTTGHNQQEDNPDNSWAVFASTAFDGTGVRPGLYATLGQSVKLTLDATKTPSSVELAMLEPHITSYIDHMQVTRVHQSAWLGVAWEAFYEADEKRWPSVVSGLMEATPFPTYEKVVRRSTTNFKTEDSNGSLSVGQVTGNDIFLEQSEAQRPNDVRLTAALAIRNCTTGAHTKYVYTELFGASQKLRGEYAEQFGTSLAPIGDLAPDALTEGKVWHFITCLGTSVQAIKVQKP